MPDDQEAPPKEMPPEEDSRKLESLPEKNRSDSELRAVQEELRELRRLFLAEAGSRNTAHDGDAFGGDKFEGDKHVHMAKEGKGKDPWRIGPIASERWDDIKKRFAGTPSKETLIRLLESENVAVLKGPPGTGRKTTALAALAHRLNELDTIGARKSPALLDKERLTPGHGYLYDASAQGWAKRLTEADVLGCRDTLVALGARLVILVGLDSDTATVSELVAEHEQPDPLDVLSRQLAHRLADAPHDLQDVLGRIQDHPTSPRDARDLATELAKGLRAGRRVEDICAARLAPRRREARDVLRQQDSERDLGRRAFVIAGAVLDGLPTVQVCRAAYDLAKRLFEVEKKGKEAELGLLPFADMLDDWLRHAREVRPSVVQEKDRILSFRAGFAPAVLDTVWLDYVVAHEALLEWLSHLAGEADPRVRLKVAQAVGRFAVYDFDFIYRQCIAAWSGSRFEALHMAAAWSLEAIVAECPSRHAAVADLAWDWARRRHSGDIYRQSTAVRLLGTLLGTEAADRAMHALLLIALRHRDVLHLAIRDTVVELYTGGASRLVVQSLLDWARYRPSALGPLVAACLTKLSQLQAGDRPALLAQYDEDPVPVSELWRQVLASPHCGQGPWNALRDWASGGVGFDELRDDLYAEPALRPRLRFYRLVPKERAV